MAAIDSLDLKPICRFNRPLPCKGRNPRIGAQARKRKVEALWMSWLHSMSLSCVCAGFVDPKTNNFPGSTMAYCSDGISIVIGAVMGTSPVTVFVGELPLSLWTPFCKDPAKPYSKKNSACLCSMSLSIFQNWCHALVWERVTMPTTSRLTTDYSCCSSCARCSKMLTAVIFSATRC